MKEQFDHLHSLLRGKPSAIDPPALEDDDEDWSLHTNTGRQSREQDLHSQKRPLSPTRAHRSPSRVLSRAPPGDHMTVTASDGRRVYLRLRPKSTTEVNENEVKLHVVTYNMYKLHVICTCMHVLCLHLSKSTTEINGNGIYCMMRISYTVDYTNQPLMRVLVRWHCRLLQTLKGGLMFSC